MGGVAIVLILIAAAGGTQAVAAPSQPPPSTQMSVPYVPPRLLNGTPQVTPRDYPAIALRHGQQGKVTVSLSIGVDGRVASCAIVRSSTFAILDQAACRLWSTHARFAPARDAAGVPLVSAAHATIGFFLPEAPSGGESSKGPG